MDTATEASAPIVYGLALKTPAHVIDGIVGALTRYHRRIGSRWHPHDFRLQAVLTCAFLEGGHTYRSLAQGNGVPKSTCHTLIQEGIKVLARRALPLTEVVRLAVKAGWDYLIVDGVNIPTERINGHLGRKQPWYSGKHKRHGGSVTTIAAPDGELLWISGVLPGRTVDIHAARRFRIADKVLAHLGLLADLGYIGLHSEVITGYKRRRGEKALPAGKKAANQTQAALRAIGERANAQLKGWKVLACDFRGSPHQITVIVKAVLTLQYLIRDPFGLNTNETTS
ncbi:transposase family protein [Streptomyces gibsoniae]|uniref:Transposase family protein n=1 Tax=Streptomyces gibsoniae TaxID=3075529 RepID=A0ABU2U570_9ACTN|nr:transposase family protein [Streptomyces sp. DSM 41699]MDT0468380.1 transposase family protein [Streptomyces sp. DSM 41699]